MATVKKVKKAQRGGCVSTMSSQERTNFFRGGTEGQLRRAAKKQDRENARAERKEARVEKRAAKKAAPEAKAGKSIKKAQRGGCVSNMSSGERTSFFRGASEGQLRRANNKMSRQVARDERKEARAEKKAAKKAAPAKYGKMVKKAVSKKK